MERALLWWPVMPYAEEQINIHSCFQTMNSEIVSGLTQTSIRCKPLRYTVVTDILQPSMERVMDSNFWTSKDFKEYPQPKVKKRRASSNPRADMGNLTADNGFWQSSVSTQSDGHLSYTKFYCSNPWSIVSIQGWDLSCFELDFLIFARLHIWLSKRKWTGPISSF